MEINGPPFRPEAMLDCLHDRPETQTQNARGEWVPAIPLPFYGWGWPWFWTVRCECGRRFKSEPAYRGHYALVHVLGLS